MNTRSLDERFTDIADVISERMGRWQVSVNALVLVLAWTLYCAFTQGSGWWYSSFYNFPLNLVTTVAELFIGFLIAAAANRVEKHNRELQAHQELLLTKIETQEEQNTLILQRMDTILEGQSALFLQTEKGTS